MDSSFITIRWRNHLWFVASALFVLWYFLVYVHDWSSIQGVSSITQNYANPIESREVTRKLNKISIMSPSIDNENIENELESANGKEVKEAEQVETKNGREKQVSPIREIKEESDSETEKPKSSSSSSSSSCSGRYIYVHEIPRRFNEELVENCKSLSNWTNMCNYMTNMGLGQRLPSDKVFTNTGWFATHQFSLEIIIHNRMKQYKCLTNDSSKASAIFVPYYAGLDVARYLWGSNVSTRDSGSIDVYKWVREQPEWKSFLGRDHFLVAGRITWDFRRGVDVDAAWGNKLMLLPESKNITMLTIESSPWNSNDFAIPYPTYFHPSSDNEVFQWQNKMRRLRRRFLFSFAGAPRPNMEYSIRSEIMQQCQASRRKCKLLECRNESNKCLKPAFLMKLFLNSVFCLQPSGDSFTRRSTFDSILAGCIPVFFHPASAYVQYLWHLPKNFNKYSVLLPEDDVRNNTIRIETELEKIPKAKVAAMREEVIKLIPKVIYADPRSRLETIEDAFDLTVKGVLERIETLRRESREGRNFSSDGVGEEFNWKYSFFGSLGNNEWDHYFIRKGKDKYW